MGREAQELILKHDLAANASTAGDRAGGRACALCEVEGEWGVSIRESRNVSAMRREAAGLPPAVAQCRLGLATRFHGGGEVGPVGDPE